ncbi:MAG: DUF465 domain-containing protein [Bryobacteraceae bacterium]|nr:DUF465 domain-containing protein [Bryobacteraceae bacterium]
MDVTSQDDLKAHLMATDEQFRQLAAEHTQYDHLIEELEAKTVLTGDEEIEEHRLKKLKLHLKDQMTEIMNRYRTQPVA